jgi:mevalonate kinase
MEARETRGHACGKVILLGEHAVVYGVPALAVGIDRGARAVAVTSEGPPSRLRVRGWNISVRDNEDGHDLARAFRAVLDASREDRSSLPPVSVEVEADLPPGGGLGCSAAMGVAIARAVDPSASEDAIQERAMAWERVFHGNPSGVDAAVSARGGCAFFRKGEALERVRVRGTLHLCVGSTGIASSTKTMVDGVAKMRARRPDVVAKTFEAIRSLVGNARVAIETGDRATLGKLMDLNQMLLSGLFVSSSEIERMCGAARRVGALGAKLTGAGGGGSVVALVPSTLVGEAVIEAWRAEGFDAFATTVAPETRARLHETESDTAP